MLVQLRRWLGAVALTILPGWAGAQAREPLAIVHVTVIDVATGNRLPDRTVITRGNRIVSVAPAATASIPRDARVVDGGGKFLIPGLWDMHVHAAWPDRWRWIGPLFIANGVTGVREMWGAHPVIARWRDALKDGSFAGPRMVASGNLIDGAPPIWPTSLVARTAAEGRRLVASEQAAGAEFIKVYARLSRDTYFAIADEAKRRRIPFVGHVPFSVTAAEASDAGQKSFEHLVGIAAACTPRGDELQRARDSLMRAPPDTTRRGMLLSAVERETRETFVAARCDSLYRRFVANGTWQVPTLTVLRGQAYQNDTALTNDPRLKYLPPAIVSGWDYRSLTRARVRAPEVWAEARLGFDRSLEIVGAMSRAGVAILAGTDVTNPHCLPGFSLHDELELLVRSGLTPLQALQAATLSPAKFFNATDSLGAIDAGKVADLLLLDADPLTDVTNTTKIRAVIADGRLFDRARLDAMLASASRP